MTNTVQLENSLFNRFKDKLLEYGCILDESENKWHGTHSKYRAICINGHECWPQPVNIKMGKGPCIQCGLISTHSKSANIRKIRSEKEYRIYLEIILNAKPLWDVWYGVAKQHKVQCCNGHISTPFPSNVLAGQGICKICAGNDSVTAEESCKERLARQKITPLWKEWKGVSVRHMAICSNNHICWILPASINKGCNGCRLCINIIWDIFYLVCYSNKSFKLGITSNDPSQRLKVHNRLQYSEVIYLVTNIDAKILEEQLLVALKNAGYIPIKGREYFSADALSFVLNELSLYNLENEAY